MMPIFGDIQALLDDFFELTCSLRDAEDLDHELLVRCLLSNALDAHFYQLEVTRGENDVREFLGASILQKVTLVLLVSLQDVLDRQDDVVSVVACCHLIEQSHHGLEDIQAEDRLLDEVIVH